MIERRPSLRPPLHDGGLSVGNASMLPALRSSVGSLRARLTRPRHFSRKLPPRANRNQEHARLERN
jgi:hypothetical protein